MVKSASVHLESWSRFTCNNLVIVPELVGATCEFPFEKAEIKIVIPGPEHLYQRSSNDLPKKDSLLFISGWETVNGVEKPYKISVDSIEIVANLRKILPFSPTEKHRTHEQHLYLSKVTEEHEIVTKKAFDYWVRVLRWQSGLGSLGRPEISSVNSGWGTILRAQGDTHTLSRSAIILQMTTDSPINLEQWQRTQHLVKMGGEPPVYIDLMYDGITQYVNHDFRRSIIDLAVACEVLIRTRVMNSLPSNLNPKIKQYIDETGIRQFIKYFKETLTDTQSSALRDSWSDIQKLFDDRNGILHSGDTKNLPRERCKKYIDVARKFVNTCG